MAVIACCSIESVENESNSFNIDLKHVSPIFEHKVNTAITPKKYKLIYFEKDGGCVACIASLKNWYDHLVEKNEYTHNIDIYFILSKNDSVVIKHNLIVLNLSHHIYWDYNGMVENKVDSLNLKGIILLNNNDKIVLNIDPKTSDVKQEFRNILQHTLKVKS